MFFVIREGEIKAAFEEEEEAESWIDNDLEESRLMIRDDYGLDDETSDEEVEYMVGREYGIPYYEEIDVDSLGEDDEYETSEGDTFSKGELEEWVE